MKTMLKTVSAFINNNNLLPPHAKVIVGLSGGADSIALLDVLTLLGYECIAAHCNFHLRGEESDRDAEFVKKWCKKIDISLLSIDFDTTQYAADRKISIEMAARELRYNWFEIERNNHEATAIAVAHHRDDSVETVLLNLIRGTGIKGLTGISSKNGYVVRPLLCVSRLKIIDYLKNRDIPYVVDSTNLQDNYKRNYIRLNVIPQMEILNPSVSESIQSTSGYLKEIEKIYSLYIKQAKTKVISNNKIHIPSLQVTLSPTSLLYEILSPLGFNKFVIDDIIDNLDSTPGKIFYGSRYRLLKDRTDLILELISEKEDVDRVYSFSFQSSEIWEPIHLKIETKNRKDVSFVKNKNILFADADKLISPLKLRKWRSGDWFIPFGMRGKKKLSDYFTDRKLSLYDKENIWLILSGDDIIWVVGNRSDDRYKITKETTKVVIIEFIDN